MARRPDTLEKSWIIGPSRGTQTFNAPSNLFIDYGRHIATVSGRGGSGNAPDAVYTSNYSTNYNIAYPTANQPIANRPETAWTTNYNVVYPVANQPIANQPATAFTTNYSTNYNPALDPSWSASMYFSNTGYLQIGAVPEGMYNNSNGYELFPYSGTGTSFDTGGQTISTLNPYSITGVSDNLGNGRLDITYTNFPGSPGNIANQPVANQPATAYSTNYSTFYNVVYPVANQPATAYSTNYSTFYNVAYPVANQPEASRPATAYSILYNTNYNVAYPVENRPIANQPATVYTINYEHNYNIAYPIASQPEAARPVTAYSTNYNVAYPIANQPVANQPATAYTINYNTNYNVIYPLANQPITAWTTNYSTNYNIAYPISNQPLANQPITSYTPGNVGSATNVLGVNFPGGPIDLSGFSGPSGIAPYIAETVVQYWQYPDNSNYPVAVPPGGQIVVKIE